MTGTWPAVGSPEVAPVAAAGMVGGPVTGAMGIGDPPMVAFPAAGPFTAVRNRAAINLCIVFVQIVAVVMYWIGGLFQSGIGVATYLCDPAS